MVLVALWASLAGCGRTFRSTAIQPNPLVTPLETLRVSEEITIVTGDMELTGPSPGGNSGGALWVDTRYPLLNKASFTVVSRDRLRFHIQIEHKWQEWADLKNWEAELVDDQGRHYEPIGVDQVRDQHVVKMWDYEQRSVVTDRYGDIVAVNQDSFKRRTPLYSLSLFRGKGDVVFYHRDLFTPKVKSLTLKLKKAGTAYQFTWRFSDDQGDGIATAMR
jgi:hypothetical protein